MADKQFVLFTMSEVAECATYMNKQDFINAIKDCPFFRRILRLDDEKSKFFRSNSRGLEKENSGANEPSNGMTF